MVRTLVTGREVVTLLLVQELVGSSLAEKETKFHVHSSVACMPLSMELGVWLVIGGGCSHGSHKEGPPKLG